MFQDPAFFVALSFVSFCVVVYLWQGKSIKKALLDAINARIDPIHKAEKNFHDLEAIWQQARMRMENVSSDVKDIQHYYNDVLKKSLEDSKRREELWLQTRKHDILAFKTYQQKKADDKALQTVLDEFMHESSKSI